MGIFNVTDNVEARTMKKEMGGNPIFSPAGELNQIAGGGGGGTGAHQAQMYGDMVAGDTLIVGTTTMPVPTEAIPQEGDVMFGAGFTDCAQEAIDYLLQVEKLAENDPVVVGLKQHLLETQERLGLDQYGVAVVADEMDSSDDGCSDQFLGLGQTTTFVPRGTDSGCDHVTSQTTTDWHSQSWWDCFDSQLQQSQQAPSYNTDIDSFSSSDLILCPRDTQINELTCELIELLAECPDWVPVSDESDVSDADDSDCFDDVAEDMELTW